MSRVSLLRNILFLCAIVGFGFPSSARSEERDSRDTADQLIVITTPEGKHPQNERIWREAQMSWAHLEGGDRAFKAGHYQTALGHYIKASQFTALRFERIEPTKKVAMAYEALGNLQKAIETVNGLLNLMEQAPATPETLRWKQALETAARGQYSLAAQYYRERLSSARDSEKKALLLEQRLHLMEARARAAGQLPPTSQEAHVRADNASADPSLIAAYILSEFKKETGIDLRNVEMAYKRVREAAAEASVQLQIVDETEVYLPFITADASGPKHINMIIKREALRKFGSGKTGDEQLSPKDHE